MLRRSGWLVVLFLAFGSWASAQQSSNLVGTWVGKVQGFGVEMRLVLNADGSADYEGVMGRWRAQGNRLLFTQEGETVAYNFTLQGSQLTLSGGDLMAPMVMTRAGGGARMDRAPAPPQAQPPSEEDYEEAAPPVQPAPSRGPATRAAPQPAAGKRALSEAEVGKLLEGGVPSRRVIELVEERGIAFPVTSASVSRLKAKGATNALIGALQQAEDRGGGEMAAAPAQPVPMQHPSAARPGVAAGGGVPSRGPRYHNEKMGLSFVTPPGWKVGERQGLLLMGSDTEAGLIIIRLARRTTLQQLVQDYGEGMQEEGLQLMPTTAAQPFPAGGNQGAAGELAGVAQDGARLRARAIAVAGPFGDAAVVMGLTTEEKYPGLKPRVESIAASFQFSPPQAPPVLEAIAGQWFYISSSTFGSSERYLNLCSDGRFSESSNIYSSGSAGTAYGEGGGGTAQWTADGDENQGTVSVTYPNGKTSQFQYRRGDGGLYVGGRKYARYGDGSCTKTSVY
jgi:hypothetical protein